MMNNDNKQQELDVVENQEVVETPVAPTLEEQTKEAELIEKTEAELDLKRTKLGFKRAIQRLIDEEGFEVDQEAEEKRIAYELALENEIIAKQLEGKQVKKVIIIKGRLVNIIA